MEEPRNPARILDEPDEGSPENRAFSTDLIREIILDYVIHDGETVIISNLCSSRLVNKAWLESTDKVLRACQQPLFRFYLGRETTTLGKDSKWEMENESLCDFLLSLKGNDSGYIPTHGIAASQEYFCLQENHQSFFDYLDTCGSGLVELAVNLAAVDQGNTNAIPPNTSFLLPRLRTFSAILHPRKRALPDSGAQNKFDFIQRVLTASEKLKSFHLTGSSIVPTSCNSVRLPSSLTEIKLECFLTDSTLVSLVNSSLPKLKCLQLFVNDKPFKGELISRILKNVRKTLSTFQVTDRKDFDWRLFPRNQTTVQQQWRPTTTFLLPLMEKLEMLEIPNLELLGSLSLLESRLPVLRHLKLTSKPGPFSKLIHQSCFPSVQSLAVFLVTGDYNELWLLLLSQTFIMANFELREMEALPRAFPNLQELDIGFRGTEVSALVPVMREMTGLRILKIRVGGQVENLTAWNALFSGVSVESLVQLRESPDLLDRMQAESVISIRNLSELCKLELYTVHAHEFQMITDVAFNFAFFKMPKLITLSLMGGFITTPEIKKKWEQQGRRIIY